MARKKKIEKEEVKEGIHGFYKGYDIKWLKTEPSHPDFYLVEEYEREVKK